MAGLVELRSIDVAPDEERHGTAFSQFTLRLGADLQITAVVTGALTVVFGGDAVRSRHFATRAPERTALAPDADQEAVSRQR
ncbi:hypothetical protein GCM10010121_039280 [Streptomyces brasiliensis]|uniref:Uncharacterized protein n=1 Tax=Streptomyces brasiliensis TaxID=1954 RepID=A0A917KPV5_9ACTN|nr:hypothetical protein GCM10010121_039280 [Streptomyces brasiliensis]